MHLQASARWKKWRVGLSARLFAVRGLRKTRLFGRRGQGTQGPAGGVVAERGPPSLQLPLELWAEIISYLPTSSLASVACLCKPLYAEVEPVLYRSVSLTTETVLSFYRTLTNSGRHAAYVRRFNISLNEGENPFVPPCLAEILCEHIDPQSISLSYKNPLMLCADDIAQLTSIFEHFFPRLGGFRTNLAPAFVPAVQDLIHRHVGLRELHLEMDDRCSLTQLKLPPALRTLSTMPRCSRTAWHSTRTLTHLHLGRWIYEDLVAIAENLGPRLVSLRLGRYMPTYHAASWSLADFEIRFPRLRFLHIDMGSQHTTPTLPHHPIDWELYTSTSNTPLPAQPTCKLTIVWGFAHEDGVVLSSAAAWHKFLNNAAFNVLKRWAPYVERIVFRHTIIPYVSATLDHQNTRLVRTQDTEMSGDYWRWV
ncbi:hypothetical protein C8Q77DRAFT_816897 [Trametes polyzona]|nr:hypothetical protein C8Q77DRAFT_816897 [Trametes polyzona]